MIETNAHGSSTNRSGPVVPEKAAKIEMVPRNPDKWRAATALVTIWQRRCGGESVWRAAKPFPTFSHHALTFGTTPNDGGRSGSL
jgi:hypothetical protein